MDFYRTLTRAWNVILLKSVAIKELTEDKNATLAAGFIVIFSALLLALKGYLFPSVLGEVTYRLDFTAVFSQTLLMSFQALVLLCLTGYLAEKLFHSKFTAEEYFRVGGHAYLITLIDLLPIFGLGKFWFFIILLILLSREGRLSIGSLIGLFLLDIVLLGGLRLTVQIAKTVL